LSFAVAPGDGVATTTGDLDFAPGTMTLVLGPPGSGKTTFLKALSGTFDGCNLQTSTKHSEVAAVAVAVA